MKTKVCTKCKRELPVSMFSKSSAKKDGLCTHCKDCHRQDMRDYRYRLTLPQKEKLYALYQGDTLLCIGTVEQLAKWQGVSVDTIKFYASPKGRSRYEDGMSAYLIEDDYETD